MLLKFPAFILLLFSLVAMKATGSDAQKGLLSDTKSPHLRIKVNYPRHSPTEDSHEPQSPCCHYFTQYWNAQPGRVKITFCCGSILLIACAVLITTNVVTNHRGNQSTNSTNLISPKSKMPTQASRLISLRNMNSTMRNISRIPPYKLKGKNHKSHR